MTDEQRRAAMAHLDALFPLNALLTISEAFTLQRQLADGLRIAAYKNENQFHRALRKFSLTIDVQGPEPEAAGKAAKLGITPMELWQQSHPPYDDRVFAKSEMTSEKAVRALFDKRSARRRQLDRERKAAKPAPRKISKKNTRKAEPQKAEYSAQKRNVKRKKRNPAHRKRKLKRSA